MDNMFASTKMQICDFYGRVNEDAWAKEDVALCAPCTCSSEACELLVWVLWVCFPRHCPTCPRCAPADADADAVAAVAVAVDAGERCSMLQPQGTECAEGSSACFPHAFAGRIQPLSAFLRLGQVPERPESHAAP